MRDRHYRVMLITGLVLLGLGVVLVVGLVLFLPTPACPGSGLSAACNRASEAFVGALALAGVGACAVIGGGVGLINLRRPNLEQGRTSDSAMPIVDPGLTYMYQRKPPSGL